MNENRDIVLRIDRKSGILLAGVLAVAWGSVALSEQLTLTTSYPVPSGIYNQLITTGNSGAAAADTTFNRNAGNTILVPATNASGKVGIGTSNPASKLQVAGGVQMGDDTSSCTADKAGTLRWHSDTFEQCRSSAWVAVSTSTSKLPARAWGSAWDFIDKGEEITYTHNLGTRYVMVYLEGKDKCGRVHQVNHGSDGSKGALWKFLTPTEITVKRADDDVCSGGTCTTECGAITQCSSCWDQIRTKIWKIENNSGDAD